MQTSPSIKDVALAQRGAERIIRRKDGSQVVPIKDGLYDLFQGKGFENHSRFRVVKFRNNKGEKTAQLIHVSGIDLNRELREQLLKEMS